MVFSRFEGCFLVHPRILVHWVISNSEQVSLEHLLLSWFPFQSESSIYEYRGFYPGPIPRLLAYCPGKPRALRQQSRNWSPQSGINPLVHRGGLLPGQYANSLGIGAVAGRYNVAFVPRNTFSARRCVWNSHL